MCLYPKLIINPKYKPTKKNKGIVPKLHDQRIKYVPIGCQECMECRKKKAREWQARLLEHLKHNNNGKFVTLTFSNEQYAKLLELHRDYPEIKGYALDNSIATIATRRFLERWRKEFKISLSHWLVTELGHNGTENIHLHGIIWTNQSYDSIRKHWKYGFIWPRPHEERDAYVNNATVNYTIKYVNKIDHDHRHYKSKILTSPGIGKGYMQREDSKRNIFNGDNTREYYKTPTGHKIGLPIYWRNHIYSEREREILWINKLDKQERWVGGERIDISRGEDQYYECLKFHQRRSEELGYGNGQIDWNKKAYEEQLRALKQAERTRPAKPVLRPADHATRDRRRPQGPHAGQASFHTYESGAKPPVAHAVRSITTDRKNTRRESENIKFIGKILYNGNQRWLETNTGITLYKGKPQFNEHAVLI